MGKKQENLFIYAHLHFMYKDDKNDILTLLDYNNK